MNVNLKSNYDLFKKEQIIYTKYINSTSNHVFDRYLPIHIKNNKSYPFRLDIDITSNFKIAIDNKDKFTVNSETGNEVKLSTSFGAKADIDLQLHLYLDTQPQIQKYTTTIQYTFKSQNGDQYQYKLDDNVVFDDLSKKSFVKEYNISDIYNKVGSYNYEDEYIKLTSQSDITIKNSQNKSTFGFCLVYYTNGGSITIKDNSDKIIYYSEFVENIPTNCQQILGYNIGEYQSIYITGNIKLYSVVVFY